MRLLKVLLATFYFVLMSQNATAHALRAVAQFDGQFITGSAYYSDHTAATNTYVAAQDKNNPQKIIEGQTDNKGNFSLTVTNPDTDYLLIVEGEEGHKVAVDVQKIILSTDNQASASFATAELAIVRQDIEKLKDKLYLHDIISGIGYIVGVLGFWAFARARKYKQD